MRRAPSTILQYACEHRLQVAKFVIVGFVTFGIYFTSFHLFYGLAGIDYKIAVSLAYVITVISHFLLHRFFTFGAGDQLLAHNAAKYLLMLGLNYTITLMIVWFVVEILKISPYFGVIASTAATTCSNFFVMKYFVFRKQEIAS